MGGAGCVPCKNGGSWVHRSPPADPEGVWSRVLRKEKKSAPVTYTTARLPAYRQCPIENVLQRASLKMDF